MLKCLAQWLLEVWAGDHPLSCLLVGSKREVIHFVSGDSSDSQGRTCEVIGYLDAFYDTSPLCC